MEELGESVEKFVEDNTDKLPEQFQPVLTHTDYSPDNVLWKDGEITGVIDWDYARSSYAVRDLVNSANAFWMNDPGADWDIRETFYQGYQEIREPEESFEQEEKFYRVETLASLTAGLLRMDALDQREQEFYREEMMQEIEN